MNITNPANLQEALRAAENVLNALDKLRADLADDATTTVIFDGQTMTGAQALAMLNATTFTIVDTFLDNGGVGGATYDPSGNHRVEFHFESFDGDGDNDYAHPNYQNGEGLAGIILHELGHVTGKGHQFYDNSNIWHARELSDGGDVSPNFNGSPYWLNREAYSNSFAQTFADAFEIDIDTWAPAEGSDWTNPIQLYQSRMGGPASRVSIIQASEDFDIREEYSQCNTTFVINLEDCLM